MTPTPRRWNHRHHPRVTASEIVVWTIVTALTAAALLGLCMLLTLAAPS